jgi:hypothetical protein
MSKETGSNLFADRPLMTIRVSHDSGQTWEPGQAVFTTDGLSPLLTTAWPPCQCRRCTERGRCPGS